jgi:hypothetical protein
MKSPKFLPKSLLKELRPEQYNYWGMKGGTGDSPYVILIFLYYAVCITALITYPGIIFRRKREKQIEKEENSITIKRFLD